MRRGGADHRPDRDVRLVVVKQLLAGTSAEGDAALADWLAARPALRPPGVLVVFRPPSCAGSLGFRPRHRRQCKGTAQARGQGEGHHGARDQEEQPEARPVPLTERRLAGMRDVSKQV